MASERIEKLRESVYGPGKSEDASKPEMEKIIKRLQKTMASEQPDEKAGRLAGKVEGRPAAQKFDPRKVSFEPEKPGRDGGLLGIVGKVYASFQPLVDSLASFVSKLPTAQNLRNDLDASDLNMSPETFMVTATVASMSFATALMLAVIAVGLQAGNAAVAGIAPLIGLLAFFAFGFLSLTYPSMAVEDKAVKINRELPFALRHLSTQIKAGVSFHRALASVAAADYGVLSRELEKTLRELERGSSTEEALLSLTRRTRSVGLKKTVIQIIRALKSGGNLSEIIKEIANDVSFESQMRIRDFVEKLNIVNVVFTMIAVVGPVVVTIISAVSSLPALGGGVPFSTVVAIFVIDIAAMTVIVWVIRKMESGL
jgi:flagellar protein FlaJ